MEITFLYTDYDLDAFRDIKPFQALPKSKDCDRYSDLTANGFLNWSACPQPMSLVSAKHKALGSLTPGEISGLVVGLILLALIVICLMIWHRRRKPNW